MELKEWKINEEKNEQKLKIATVAEWMAFSSILTSKFEGVKEV